MTPYPSSTGPILFIIADGATALDTAGPMEVFETANAICHMRDMPMPYTMVVASARGNAIRTRTGLEILTRPLSDYEGVAVDTIIIGGRGTNIEDEDYVIRWLQKNVPSARRICSVCVGSFVLAKAGLLDSKTATTHWASVERFTTEFPSIDVKTDKVFVRDGIIWTSAGVLTGVDLALQLVEDDLGRDVSMRIAKVLVSYIRRSAENAQFSEILNIQSSSDADFSSLLHWISQNLNKDLSIPTIAARVGMTPRTFARKFKKSTGATPGDAITRIRTDAARQIISGKQRSMKDVAAIVGFRAEVTLRRALRKYNACTIKD